MLKRVFRKTILVSFILSISLIRVTNAFYQDQEVSTDGDWNSAGLDMVLKSDQTDFIPNTITKNKSYTRDISVENIGTVPFFYRLEYNYVKGVKPLCNTMLLSVKLNGGEQKYSGLLKDFNYTIGSPLQVGEDNYTFEATIPKGPWGKIPSKTCKFDISAVAWQENMVDETHGFWDEENMENKIKTTNLRVKYGDVVINELMWMGSTVGARDEWIELRNMTDNPIDIGKWIIENARAANRPPLMIPASRVIPAHGYFLIANNPEQSANTALNTVVHQSNASISLLNTGEQLVLRNGKKGIVIDRTPIVSQASDHWAAGEISDHRYYSMQRELIPRDGDVSNNWYTCYHRSCNDGIYWDTPDGSNYGTPGGKNSPEVVRFVISEKLETSLSSKPDEDD